MQKKLPLIFKNSVFINKYLKWMKFCEKSDPVLLPNAFDLIILRCYHVDLGFFGNSQNFLKNTPKAARLLFATSGFSHLIHSTVG